MTTISLIYSPASSSRWGISRPFQRFHIRPSAQNKRCIRQDTVPRAFLPAFLGDLLFKKDTQQHPDTLKLDLFPQESWVCASQQREYEARSSWITPNDKIGTTTAMLGLTTSSSTHFSLDTEPLTVFPTQIAVSRVCHRHTTTFINNNNKHQNHCHHIDRRRFG